MPGAHIALDEGRGQLPIQMTPAALARLVRRLLKEQTTVELANIVQVDVVTLPAGSDATADVTGPPESLSVTIGVPRGPVGPTVLYKDNASDPITGMPVGPLSALVQAQGGYASTASPAFLATSWTEATFEDVVTIPTWPTAGVIRTLWSGWTTANPGFRWAVFLYNNTILIHWYVSGALQTLARPIDTIVTAPGKWGIRVHLTVPAAGSGNATLDVAIKDVVAGTAWQTLSPATATKLGPIAGETQLHMSAQSTTLQYVGKRHSALVRQGGIAGTIRAQPDLTRPWVNGSHVDPNGNVWTIQGIAQTWNDERPGVPYLPTSADMDAKASLTDPGLGARRSVLLHEEFDQNDGQYGGGSPLTVRATSGELFRISYSQPGADPTKLRVESKTCVYNEAGASYIFGRIPRPPDEVVIDGSFGAGSTFQGAIGLAVSRTIGNKGVLDTPIENSVFTGGTVHVSIHPDRILVGIFDGSLVNQPQINQTCTVGQRYRWRFLRTGTTTCAIYRGDVSAFGRVTAWTLLGTVTIPTMDDYWGNARTIGFEHYQPLGPANGGAYATDRRPTIYAFSAYALAPTVAA